MGKALKVAAIVSYCKPFITQAMNASGSPPKGVNIDEIKMVSILAAHDNAGLPVGSDQVLSATLLPIFHLFSCKLQEL